MHTLLRKILPIFLAFFLFATYFKAPVFAAQDSVQDSFSIQADISYTVLATFDTRVSQDITITNKKEFVYAPSYDITLRIKNIQNIAVVSSKGGSIPYTVKDLGADTKGISINFPDKVVGVGAQNNFTLSFTTSDFAKKSGTITRVTVPALSDPQGFMGYTVHVIVPTDFGDPTLVKPSVAYQKNGNTFTFTKDNLRGSTVDLYFGEFQLYRFKLSYHLENKNLFPIKTELALPPNTSYQEVLLENLFPKPESTYKDTDGNILAVYSLPPKTIRNVQAQVLIKVFDTPTPEKNDPDLNLYLKPQKYWESTDPEIIKLAQGLKTPEAIYDYVVKTLEYDDHKVADQNTRLGAKKVLSKPYFAVCLEFTDLFVALSRAAGIPARAVEGYAYTGDASDKPATLFKDVLHAWPEYYDTQTKTWIAVDPTWEDTTKGTDYFHSLDFDHVAFTVNGKDSSYPVPAGGYKTEADSQDIIVSFPEAVEFVKDTKVGVTGSFSSFTSNSKVNGKVTLQNSSNYEIPTYKVFLYVDGRNTMSVDFPATPPYGESSVSVSIPMPQQKDILTSLTNLTHKITIQNDQGEVLSTSQVRTLPFSEFLLLGGGIFVAITAVFIIAFKTRSVPVQRP